MKSQDEFALIIAQKLTDAGIPYMIAGSFLANLYGQFRATHDTDIVVDCDSAQLDAFAGSLESDCYVSRQAMFDAIVHRSMFNVIDTNGGWKADIIIRRDRPFSVEEFGRRRQIPFQGQTVWVASPEDAILSKLEWARKADSERQLRDAASIFAIQQSGLNIDYIRNWAECLKVTSELDLIMEQSDSLEEDNAD